MTTLSPIRVAVLDDYQHVAEGLADWHGSRHPRDVRFIRTHIEGEYTLAQLLEDAEVIVVMRERTPLSSRLLSKKLRLIVTTGMRNDSVERVDGVTLCSTYALTTPTVELTWAPILGLSRHLGEEEQSLRAGTWQTTVGEGLAGRTEPWGCSDSARLERWWQRSATPSICGSSPGASISPRRRHGSVGSNE